MKTDQVEIICDGLFGENWRGSFADAFNLDHSTRWRMLKREEVTGPVEAALTAWVVLHRAFSILPPKHPYGAFFNSFGVVVEAEQSEINVDDIASQLFGKKWKMALASSLGINASTLWRQLTSDDGLPGTIVASLRAWSLLHKLTGMAPPYNLAEGFPSPPHALENKPRKSSKSKYAKNLLNDF